MVKLWSHTLTEVGQILPSGEIEKLDDTPSVLVTATEYVPKSSLSAFLKISFELDADTGRQMRFRISE